MNVLSRTAKLADVARAAGVSKGTASNVFNRPELVRQEVREHVRSVASAIGYSGPDPKGRLLRAGKVNAIGVATAEPLSYFFDDPFARTLMQAIAEACDARGAGLSLISAANGEKLAWNIENALVDGFVLLCIENGDRLVELSRERQLPFIALALGRSDETVPAIGIDDFAGARLAAAHLLGLGHQRFAVLAIPFEDNHIGFASPAQIDAAVYTSTRERARGYFAVLAEAGIDKADVLVFETVNDESSTIAGLEAIFARPTRPTALLCMSDRVALIAMAWLAARGLAVPGDVSIVGFDGVPEAAAASPPLTTIAQPISELGHRAVEAILDAGTAVHRETLDLTLVVRGSTAPPPALDTCGDGESR